MDFQYCVSGNFFYFGCFEFYCYDFENESFQYEMGLVFFVLLGNFCYFCFSFMFYFCFSSRVDYVII